MKIALITDTHYGVRNDSPVFLENQREFYTKVFFPYLKKNKIKDVIHLGDVFDRRKYVNFNTLNEVRSFVFDELEKREINMHMFVGNHDCYFKNTNNVNSVELLLEEYDNLVIVDEPTEVMYDDVPLMLCPWINNENYKDTIKTLNKSDADVLLGHFEINGFMMHRDTAECKAGMNQDVFKNFNLVFSGHFHEPSTNGHIWYLGAPTEYTWADHDCRRGFNIFDTETMELEHIRNPHSMFYRIFLDSELDIETFDYEQLRHKIIRIIVGSDVDPKVVETFMHNVNDVSPHDMEIIDNSSYHLEEGVVSDDEAIRNEDTVSIVESYVDSVKDDIALDADKLKGVFKNLYVEALAVDE